MLFWRSKKQLADSDEELIAMYRNSHDPRYVGELFNRYTALVYGVSMKYLKDEDKAKDAVMQIFEDMLGHLKKHKVEYFKGWLHTVTRNHCLMLLRKDNQHPIISQDFSENDQDTVDLDDKLHPNDKAEKESLLQAMELGLTHLKKEQKQCIELFYLKEKSYVEVAEITGYDLNQVKSYIQNGKRNLKIWMDNNANGET
jgi:RNA polymerase sigma-70 factor (ECF subfamily)